MAFVKKIESIEDGSVVVERMMETGYDIIQSPLPVVLTVVKEINEPRLPSLRGKMRSKKFEPVLWTARDVEADENCIGLKASPTEVIKIFTPEARKGGQIIEAATPDEAADKLYQELKEAKIIT